MTRTRDGEEQRECARGGWCAARTRDADGTWRAALSWQPYCPACTGVIRAQAAQLPGLLALAADPRTRVLARPGRAGRRPPPGPRVNMSIAADALLREAAAVLGGWAARVRSVPGLDLAVPPARFGTAERTAADCRVLAAHTVPLLALAAGWTVRRYTLLPAAAGVPADRARARCRACARVITRSPVSGWWWAADGQPAMFCDHQPAAAADVLAGPVPDPVAGGDAEIVRAGEGWMEVLLELDGAAAGAEIGGLHWQARKVTGCVPAPRQLLDGVPCRREECDTLGLERADPPPDPSVPAPYSRCPACRDEMDPGEYRDWVSWYSAWARGVVTVCRRCVSGDCGRCCWAACTCDAGPHPHRTARTAA